MPALLARGQLEDPQPRRNGQARVIGRRAELWRSFIEVVDHLQPSIVLLENVPDMARWNDGAVLLGVMQALRESGYEPNARVLDAYRYGVPQHRARLFVVATKSRPFFWPDERRNRPTLRDAIGDLPPVAPGESRLELDYSGPATPFERDARRGVPRDERSLIHDHWTRGVREDDAQAFRLLNKARWHLQGSPEAAQKLNEYLDGLE